MTRREHGGDTGQTDLLGGRRVAKSDARIEALGALDEATSALGVARQSVQRPQTGEVLRQAQRDLYQLMAELAMPPEHPKRVRVTADRVEWVEQALEELEAAVTIPAKFVLPGACAASAGVDYARAVVRRAERRVVEVAHAEAAPNPHLLAYVNRLSLLLYMVARAEDVAAGVDFDIAG